MQKIIVALVLLCVLASSCKKKYPIDPLPKDTTPPTASFQVVSVSSTTSFTPFGGTLPNSEISKGYTIQLSDLNLTVNAACSGTVTAVSSNSVTVLYRANSIYSFYYSGIKNIRVAVNQSIAPGNILGDIASDGIVFFQVIKNDTEVECPDTFSDTGFKNSIRTAINKHIILHPADSLIVPCLAASLPR